MAMTDNIKAWIFAAILVVGLPAIMFATQAFAG